MEDIYTPGYDSLLKRKEAEFRRAKIDLGNKNINAKIKFPINELNSRMKRIEE